MPTSAYRIGFSCRSIPAFDGEMISTTSTTSAAASRGGLGSIAAARTTAMDHNRMGAG